MSRSEFRESLKQTLERLQGEPVGYDPRYDAYYVVSNGRWIEGKCRDLENCEFCRTRPETYTP